MSTPASKACERCGRTISWRRKWARDWDQVRYCSQRCRRQRGTTDALIEARILALLAGRPRTASICPSEVARDIAGRTGVEELPGALRPSGPQASTDPESWRALLEPVRSGARRLVARGALEITQGGRVVDPSRARGPIRLRLPRSGGGGA